VGGVLWFLAKLVVAVVAFVVVMRVGMMVLAGLARPAPKPEEGELRRVNLRFRCSICGAEVRMVQASEELPPPPRHCLEDMELVPSPYE